MTHSRRIPGKLAVSVVVLAGSALLTSAAVAQQAPPLGYPAQNQVYQAYPAPAPAAAPTQSHPLRDLFAGTIATVLQTATGGLAGGLSGSIMNWFARKQAPGMAQGYAAGGYPSQAGSYGYPGTSTYPPGTASTYPAPSASYPSANAPYPGATYPQTAADSAAAGQTYGSPTGAYGQTGTYGQAAYPGQPGAYPGSTAGAYDTGATQVYDARSGQLVTGGANPYGTQTGGYDGTLYAGIAYEVHALTADGRSTPINPATYVFHTGDRFMVYYRPSMPGHMEIYNVNPAGQQTLIDATNMAAGQMTTLGPYQFTNLTGDESLRLVLSPCSSPQLLAATRDIVRADAAYAMAPQASGGAQLSACGTTTTRGLAVRTRDIQKVAVDGMTNYALDPVSRQELTSGQVIPREANIVFHHR
jgi:hypothetical protein